MHFLRCHLHFLIFNSMILILISIELLWRHPDGWDDRFQEDILGALHLYLPVRKWLALVSCGRQGRLSRKWHCRSRSMIYALLKILYSFSIWTLQWTQGYKDGVEKCLLKLELFSFEELFQLQCCSFVSRFENIVVLPVSKMPFR